MAEPVADDEGFESSPEKVSSWAYSVFVGLIAVFAGHVRSKTLGSPRPASCLLEPPNVTPPVTLLLPAIPQLYLPTKGG